MKRRQVGSGNHSLLWDRHREAGYGPGRRFLVWRGRPARETCPSMKNRIF